MSVRSMIDLCVIIITYPPCAQPCTAASSPPSLFLASSPLPHPWSLSAAASLDFAAAASSDLASEQASEREREISSETE